MKFQNHIGLDVGDATIKLVQLAREGSGYRLSSVGISESAVETDLTQRDNKTVEIIRGLVKQSGVVGKAVVVGLPESQVYTRVVEMPFMEETELSAALSWQAEQFIPIPLAEAVLKHQIISLPEKGVPGAKMMVLLVAAPRELVERYMAISSRAGLEILAMETELFALARSLVAGDPFAPATLIVNIANTTTSFAVLSRGNLVLTQSAATGGMAINRALMTQLGLEAVQAEEYKKEYGLDQTKFEGKVYGAISPVVDVLVAEIKKILVFSEGKGAAGSIKRIILSGGNALTPGLFSYFTARLGLEVQRANPFLQVALNEKQKEVLSEAGPLFAAAVGLAMKQT